jgi:hypothetical protein
MRFAAAPLAVLLAVQRSTGIPNIVAGTPLSRAAAALMRIAGPLLGRLLTRQAARTSNRVEPQPISRHNRGAALARMGRGRQCHGRTRRGDARDR